MKCTIVIEMGNEAMSTAEDLIMAIKRCAVLLDVHNERLNHAPLVWTRKLHDRNGNAVGHIKVK